MNERIEVADVLKGLAIAGIALIHFAEQYSFFPAPSPSMVDQWVWNAVVFLTSGKMYAIFCVLFGFSFFIQHNNYSRRYGAIRTHWRDSFEVRYIVRMFWLGLFGLINNFFYNGDFLLVYSFTGLFLLLIKQFSNRALLTTATVLVFLPVQWVILALHQLDASITLPSLEVRPDALANHITRFDGSFFEVVKITWRSGLAENIHFFFSSGRIEQALGLFTIGFYIGRNGLLYENGQRIWRRVLIFSLAASAQFIAIKYLLPEPNQITPAAHLAQMTLSMLCNLTLTGVIFSAVVVLYYNLSAAKKGLTKLTPIGRASLTNYITQSIVGSLLFYGWGLGLSHHIGIAWSVCLAILVLVVQNWFCKRWLLRHSNGPVELLWKK